MNQFLLNLKGKLCYLLVIFGTINGIVINFTLINKTIAQDDRNLNIRRQQILEWENYQMELIRKERLYNSPKELSKLTIRQQYAISLFVDETSFRISVDSDNSRGIAFGDVDGDGDFDIIIANRSKYDNNNNPIPGTGQNKLLINEGAGYFVDETSTRLPNDNFASFDVEFGDVDNDGDLDIFVTNNFGDPDRLLINSGAGIFTDETHSQLPAEPFERASGEDAEFGDVDGDGDLDIVIANGFDQRDRILINDGSGNFSFGPESRLPANSDDSQDLDLGDVDNDGDLDIIIANRESLSGEQNRLLINNGNGMFEDETNLRLPALLDQTQGVVFGDVDGDDDLDIFYANVSEESRILINNGSGFFTDETYIRLPVEKDFNYDAIFGDVDKDGYLDIFVADVGQDELLINNGDGKFTAAEFPIEDDFGSDAEFVDVDGDGDLDLIVTNIVLGSNNPQNRLYINTSTSRSISINISEIDCGEINIGDIADTTMSVRNTGSAILTVTDIVIMGKNLTEFSVKNETNFTIPMAEQKDVQIRFQPSSLGDKSASLVIFHNAPGDSTVVNLTGTGIDSESPTISSVNAESIVNFNTPLDVTSNISDNLSVQEVRLLYREGGQSSFQTATMNLNGDSYQGTIPGSVADTRGVEFAIEAVDSSGNQSRSELHAVQVQLPDKHLTRSHSGGTAQTAYRLVSFPLEMDNPSVSATLSDDLGGPDSLQWRLWEIDPQRRDTVFPFKEIRSSGSLEPGVSKFLITRETKTLTSGAGTSVNTIIPFTISLIPGWNMISSPFNFEIPITNVEPESLRIHLNTYNGSWISSPSMLKPWEGYMIKVNEPVTLTITPAQPATTVQSVTTKSTTESEWFIQITAIAEFASDNDNIAGVALDANLEWDRYERFEPPPIGKFVMVSFQHFDWEIYPDIYTTDYRPSSTDGHVWDFIVDTNIPNKLVTLTFYNVGSVPPHFEAHLVDINLNITQDIRNDSHYVYRSNRFGGKKKFKIIVGKSNFVEENIAEFVEVLDGFELSQNFPNPFNPSTTIKFGLPKKSRAFLKIYNILGQEIATLLDGVEKQAGFNSVVWDGRDIFGRGVPSGIYIYQLQANQTVLIRKMTLLK